jgi:hypothetical protein
MRLLLLLLLAVAARADDAWFAKMQKFDGDVTVNSKPAQLGVLQPGDLVEVAAKATCQLEFGDGTTATLTGHEDEGASLTLPAKAESAAAQVLKLAKGAIAIHVPSGQQSKWQVETENCTASVEGTVFAVAVGPKSKTTVVLVAEGKVKVVSKAGEVVVEKGKGTTVDGEKAPTPLENYNPNEKLGTMVEDQQGIKSSRDVIRK